MTLVSYHRLQKSIPMTYFRLSHSSLGFQPYCLYSLEFYNHILIFYMEMKIGQGSEVKTQSKAIIMNVKSYFEKEKAANGPLRSLQQVGRRTADATGVGLTTVTKICQEKKRSIEEGKPFPGKSPKRTRVRVSPVTRIDTFSLEIIRRKIHEFYLNGELPTLHKLKISLESEENVNFTGCIESLRRIVTSQFGFKFCKVDRCKHLLERTDVVSQRHSFLQQIRGMDLKHNVIFLDETWVNENHSVTSCWQSEQCYGLKVPTGKGRRLIILHAGTAEGFIPNCLLMFPSKSGLADYHADMNAEVFSTWFKEQLLANIPPRSTIIMDNASYHSVVVNKAPHYGCKKQDIINWLQKNKIPCEQTMLKADLYELVKMHKPETKRYFIDELAAAEPYNHNVIRLPPYHCQFNPIELIWAQVKGYVSARNASFKLSDVQNLMKEAIAHVTQENWLKAVQHTEKLMNEYWDKDGLIEDRIESLIIRMEGSSSEESVDSCDSDDTFQPLH